MSRIAAGRRDFVDGGRRAVTRSEVTVPPRVHVLKNCRNSFDSAIEPDDLHREY
jgi:hypothetical protein